MKTIITLTLSLCLMLLAACASKPVDPEVADQQYFDHHVAQLRSDITLIKGHFHDSDADTRHSVNVLAASAKQRIDALEERPTTAQHPDRQATLVALRKSLYAAIDLPIAGTFAQPARVAYGNPDDTGPLKAVFAKQQKQLLSVYEAALKNNPDLRGSITYTLSFDTTGFIRNVSVKTLGAGMDALEQQIRPLVNRIQVPASQQPWDGQYSLNFYPK